MAEGDDVVIALEARPLSEFDIYPLRTTTVVNHIDTGIQINITIVGGAINTCVLQWGGRFVDVARPVAIARCRRYADEASARDASRQAAIRQEMLDLITALPAP